MLGEHHLHVPVHGSLLIDVEIPGKPTQVAVERGHLVVRCDGFHTGTQQCVGQLHAARGELCFVISLEVKGDAASVQLVLTTDQFPGIVYRFAGQ
ncbi:hypothetical protein ALQ34_200034 [Pseudomonas syringae pv. maculicola]|nr:hypothetical protein ALQ34_200034 [Pseudomonas syringae pv. maculicola]